MFFPLYIIDWLQKYLLTCPSKYFLHIDCPGCGMQRSFIALMQGNIKVSLMLHPALIPILILLLYTAVHLRYDFKNGARNIKILQMVAASIIVCFYIYKIVNNKLTA